MIHVHWWLFGLAFVVGLVLTLMLIVGPLKRRAAAKGTQGRPGWPTTDASATEQSPTAAAAPVAENMPPAESPAEDWSRPADVADHVESRSAGTPAEHELPTTEPAVEDELATIIVENEAPTEILPAATEAPKTSFFAKLLRREAPRPDESPTHVIPAGDEAPTRKVPVAQAAPARKAPPAKGGPVRKAPTGRGGPVRKAPTGQGGPVRKAPTGQGGPVRKAPTGQGGPVKKAPPAKLWPEKKAPAARVAPAKKVPTAKASPTKRMRKLPFEPFGPGSARATLDGGGPAGWLVKGRTDTRLYYTPDDPAYDLVVAQVWFRDERYAARALFTPWCKSSRKH